MMTIGGKIYRVLINAKGKNEYSTMGCSNDLTEAISQALLDIFELDIISMVSYKQSIAY